MATVMVRFNMDVLKDVRFLPRTITKGGSSGVRVACLTDHSSKSRLWIAGGAVNATFIATCTYIGGIVQLVVLFRPYDRALFEYMRDGATISPYGHWAEDLASRLTATPGVSVVFRHSGPVDHSRLEELIAQAEAHSLQVKDGVSLRKRLFNVLVEGLENVHHHTPADLAASGFALLVRGHEGYRVLFGNALPAVSAELLAQRVEVLNEMDEADLREYYLKLLANEGRTERGGAGLGLLTMARKSTGPIHLHKGSSDGTTVHVALELALAAN